MKRLVQDHNHTNRIGRQEKIIRLFVYALPLLIVALSCASIATGQQSEFEPVPGAITLPDQIPLFPLQDVMLFPNITRPLHVFEPRYRKMVADALEGDRIIGMVLLQAGYEADYEGNPPILEVGCAGLIANAEELPDGRYLIVLQGLVKFLVRSEDHSGPYRIAQVEAIPELVDDEELSALHQLRSSLVSILISANGEPPPPELPDEDLVNGIAQYLAINPLERQNLLQEYGPLARAKALVALFNDNAPKTH